MQNTEAVMLYSLNNTLLRKQVHKKFRNDTESIISAISGQIWKTAWKQSFGVSLWLFDNLP